MDKLGRLEVEQLKVTSTTPPADSGFYKIDETTMGVVGDLKFRHPKTGAMSSALTVTSTSDSGIAIRATDASPGIPLPVEKSTRLRVHVVGGALYVRTPWDATYDAVQCVLVSTTRTVDANNPVELGGARRIPIATANTDIYTAWSAGAGGATLLASQGDEAPPQRYNGTTVGGNHKSVACINATSAVHGKTDSDLGSIWSDGSLQYVLSSIVDANTLRVIETVTAAIPAPSLAGETLTHVSGANNTSAINVSTSAAGLQPCLNNRKIDVFIDGTKIDPAIDGVYTGAKLVVNEEYGIVNPVSHAAWIRTQDGKRASGAAPADTVACDVIVRFCWIFGENGSIANAGRIEYVSSVAVGNTSSASSLIQAKALNYTGGTEGLYAPGVSVMGAYDFKAIVTTAGGASLTADQFFGSQTWIDAKRPPNRLAQLVYVGGLASIGQIVGNSPVRGCTSNSRFSSNTDRAGYFSTAKKAYIHVQNSLPYGSTSIPAGTTVSATGYRHIYNPKLTPDATVASWFWDGSDIIVTFDFHKTSALSTISLPAVTEGWAITIIESTAVTLFSPVVDNAQIAVACTEVYGHAQFRVSAT